MESSIIRTYKREQRFHVIRLVLLEARAGNKIKWKAQGMKSNRMLQACGLQSLMHCNCCCYRMLKSCGAAGRNVDWSKMRRESCPQPPYAGIWRCQLGLKRQSEMRSPAAVERFQDTEFNATFAQLLANQPGLPATPVGAHL